MRVFLFLLGSSSHTHTHTHTHTRTHTHTHSHTLSRPLSTSLLTSLCCLCADVAAMLRSRHADNYLVFNVSEKEYDISKLNNQVLDFGWPDHMAPPLERLCRCVAIALCLWLFVCCSFIGWPVTGAQRRETHPRTHTHTHTHPLSLSHTHTHTHTHSHTRFGLNCLEQHHQLDGIMAGQRSFPRCCCALQRRQGQNGRCCCCVFQLQANL